MNRRIEATVRGRVQGVFFRHYAAETARHLRLSGWVANHPDGTVRVVAEGEESALSRFASWLHQGSPAARVESVEIAWSDATGEFDEFRVRS